MLRTPHSIAIDANGSHVDAATHDATFGTLRVSGKRTTGWVNVLVNQRLCIVAHVREMLLYAVTPPEDATDTEPTVAFHLPTLQ